MLKMSLETPSLIIKELTQMVEKVENLGLIMIFLNICKIRRRWCVDNY